MTTSSPAEPGSPIRLGLPENLPQFLLLVAANALVGGMVGQERTVLPLLAERDFGLTAYSAMLTFIAAFGLTKAIVNYFAGTLADRFGRKPVLLAGWVVAIPVPLMLIWAPSWGWVIAANVLLGVNQGLAWSVTVIMKLDLVGPLRRGTAMGLNEAAGYGAVAVAAWATGSLAEAYGLRPAPFLMGLAFAALGLGLFPVLFAAGGLDLATVGLLTTIAPAVSSVGQLGTGALSDRVGRKWLFAGGQLTEAAGLFLIAAGDDVAVWAAGSALFGAGTAMAYPTLIAAVGDVAHPTWRGAAIGVYRLWRHRLCRRGRAGRMAGGHLVADDRDRRRGRHHRRVRPRHRRADARNPSPPRPHRGLGREESGRGGSGRGAMRGGLSTSLSVRAGTRPATD